jgi:acetylserotonin N-methyltransferase
MHDRQYQTGQNIMSDPCDTAAAPSASLQASHRPDPAPILELLNGFRKSKVLFTMVQLGIPDFMHVRGSACLADVAGHVQAHHGQPASLEGLHRLLSACVALGLLEYNSQDSSYTLSPVSREYLPTSADISLSGYVVHSDKVVYPLFGHLQHSVTSGDNAWQPAFGSDGKDIFGCIYDTPSAVLQFMAGMHSFSRLSAPSVIKAFDLSTYKSLVDLGGATGAIAVAALQAYPDMRATVVDLPHVVDIAREHFTTRQHVPDASLLQRLSWCPADFFQQPERIPLADLFVLARCDVCCEPGAHVHAACYGM